MTSTKDKPTIVLVPGMCCVGQLVYRPLMLELQSQGWTGTDLICIDNPSVDAPAKGTLLKPNGLDIDIQSLRRILSSLIETEHRDVLLVAHSYGGTPSLSAAEGLWKHQRLARGEEGGVLRAAVISSPLTLPGDSIAGARMRWQTENNIPIDAGATFEVDGDFFLDPTGFDAFWYNDIAESEWTKYILKPSAISTVLTSVQDDVKPANWRVSYLILTELDMAMPEGLQREYIDKARNAGAEVDERVLRSGHFAQISHVKEVAEWLIG